MMNFCTRFCLFLSILGSVAATAQAQRIKVLDKSDLRPIPGVLIYNQQKQQSVITDARGGADLAKFVASDTLYFSHLAFQPGKTTKRALEEVGGVFFLVEKVVNLEELVFSANRTNETRADLPNKVETVSAKQIAFNNPQTSGDLLRQTGNVFVQMSQAGGGSPVLRGFEANKVLLVVDGVRLNNAIYRGGHLQNVITLDPNMLDKVEVVYGPGSVMYGSDALGGVMHFFTRNPDFSQTGKLLAKGSAFTRWSSANQERTVSGQVSLGGQKLASFTSFTHKDFGDLRAGSVRPKGYPNIWERRFTQNFVDGRDVATPNSDVNLQTSSGYTQYDLLQKVVFKPHDDNIFTFNFQYSNSSDIPRYDRLSEANASGVPAFATWDYGPQTRLLASLKADFLAQSEFYDRASITAAYQYISEDRITRRWNSAQRTSREETVRVFSLNVDMQKDLATRHELRYGLEAAHNAVASVAYNTHVRTGAVTPASTRYPDGGSEMQSFSAYLTHAWELDQAKKLIFSQGLRYSYVSLSAQFNEKTFFPFPFDNATQRNSALNGNLGLVWNPNRQWRVALMGASGFRAANVDDLGRVFDSQPGSVVVPNPNLRPEYTYNLDLTVSRRVQDRLFVELTGFHTWFRDAILVRPAQLNGADSVVYDRVKSRVLANTNAQNATISGIQANLRAQLTTYLSLQSGLTYTYGWVQREGVPLDHVPPLYGQTSAKLELKKFKAEAWAQYNGWKRRQDYSPSGEDNLQYATPDGMPSWWTLNLRAAYQLNRFVQFQAGLENILDKHYRYFASGVSAPGRNLMLTVRGSF
jgi:hemoglobin/transferrin/lactoferrin receptor protein